MTKPNRNIRMDGPLQSLFCVGLLTLPLVLLATGCSPAKPTASDVLRPVKTMVVAEGAETHIRTFPGKVEASRKVELAFKVPGIIIELPIMEGQKVAKGDVIAQLRPDEFKARGSAQSATRQRPRRAGWPPSRGSTGTALATRRGGASGSG